MLRFRTAAGRKAVDSPRGNACRNGNPGGGPQGAPPESSPLAGEIVRLVSHEQSAELAPVESSPLAGEIVRLEALTTRAVAR
jgi:hypothetical protein